MDREKKKSEICKRIMNSDFYIIVGLTGNKDIKLRTAFCQTFATADIPQIITKIHKVQLRKALEDLLKRLDDAPIQKET